MTLRLNGSTSGYTEIDAPAVAGNNLLTLPTGNGSADQALVTNGSGALSWSDRGRMTLATAQNSTSGTSIDFTGIPSWVKRVTVIFNGVSTSGTSNPIIQVGAGSFTTSGYLGSGGNMATGVAVQNFTTGFGLFGSANWSSTSVVHGGLVISNLTGNNWAAFGNFALSSGGTVAITAGSVALSGTLDRIRITTVNGTDAFDAGTINIMYEG